VSMEDIRHFVAHPGGAKVLDALEDVLGLEQGELTYSRQVLAEYGNMSAVTVLTILQKFLETGEYAPRDLGLISAMGPGFRAEHVFFRC
jgi:alkylresorcinol/alkylpyrone synthase